jgi:hypothetical protein
MKLLPRLRIFRRLAGAKRLVAIRAAFVSGLVALEVLGRRSRSDIDDLYGLGALTILVVSWLGFDRAARRRVATRVLGIGRGLAARMPVIGIDLRGEPVLPRGEPKLLQSFAVTCALATALELGWILGIDASFRDVARHGSYLLLLVGTAAMWLGLLAILLLAVALSYVIIHDALRSQLGDRAHGRIRRVSVLAYAVIALAGMAFLPVWVALVLLGVGIALYPIAGAIHPPPRLSFLWRDPDGGVGSMDIHQWVGAQAILLGWPAALFVVAGLGGSAFGLPTEGDTPVSHALAAATAWCAGPAMVVVSGFTVMLLDRFIRNDPAMPCPTSVHVAAEVATPERERAGELLAVRGWHVRWHPVPARPADVRLRLVDRQPKGRQGWPRAVSARSLELPELLDLIARRDVVQRRRLLLRGLGRMLERARRGSFSSGTGFWLAPQHWFVTGLTRDTAEDEHVDDSTYADTVIGEPYHLALPRAARSHAYEVFSAVEIDIIFVEDGVTWLRLRRVFRRIFEHYDARGGRIEERHLHGLPGIRAIVHDLRIGEPLGRERYPEPDYEDLGRARILHVFKDRGGDEELQPDPSTDRGVPLRA